MKTIKLTESDLRKIKDIALSEYKEKSNKGMSADCFWGKCAVEAVKLVLDLEVKIAYPTNCKEIG